MPNCTAGGELAALLGQLEGLAFPLESTRPRRVGSAPAKSARDALRKLSSRLDQAHSAHPDDGS